MFIKYLKINILFFIGGYVFINCINNEKYMQNAQNTEHKKSLTNLSMINHNSMHTIKEESLDKEEENNNIIYINDNYDEYNKKEKELYTPTESNINEYPYIEYSINKIGIKYNNQNPNIKDLDIIIDETNSHLNLNEQKTDNTDITDVTNNNTPSITNYIGLNKKYSAESIQRNSTSIPSISNNGSNIPKTPRNSFNIQQDLDFKDKQISINNRIQNDFKMKKTISQESSFALENSNKKLNIITLQAPFKNEENKSNKDINMLRSTLKNLGSDRKLKGLITKNKENNKEQERELTPFPHNSLQRVASVSIDNDNEVENIDNTEIIEKEMMQINKIYKSDSLNYQKSNCFCYYLCYMPYCVCIYLNLFFKKCCCKKINSDN